MTGDVTDPRVRVDLWLWAVRLTPSRSAATELCRSGRVTINDVVAKASSIVHVGDRIEARIAQRQRAVEVVEVIRRRVGAPIAAKCFVDHSPLVVRDESSPPQRDRGTGRPTKRDRRLIERLRSDP